MRQLWHRVVALDEGIAAPSCGRGDTAGQTAKGGEFCRVTLKAKFFIATGPPGSGTFNIFFGFESLFLHLTNFLGGSDTCGIQRRCGCSVPASAATKAVVFRKMHRRT